MTWRVLLIQEPIFMSQISRDDEIRFSQIFFGTYMGDLVTQILLLVKTRSLNFEKQYVLAQNIFLKKTLRFSPKSVETIL